MTEYSKLYTIDISNKTYGLIVGKRYDENIFTMIISKDFKTVSKRVDIKYKNFIKDRSKYLSIIKKETIDQINISDLDRLGFYE